MCSRGFLFHGIKFHRLIIIQRQPSHSRTVFRKVSPTFNKSKLKLAPNSNDVVVGSISPINGIPMSIIHLSSIGPAFLNFIGIDIIRNIEVGLSSNGMRHLRSLCDTVV